MKIKVPDFEDMAEIIGKIYEISLEKIKLQLEIKTREAEIIKKVTTNQEYFVNNKPPSMSYIESTYKWTGLDGELIPKRNELANLTSKLEHARNTLDLYRNMISLYQTESANKRAATL